MSNDILTQFLKCVLTQVKINRLMHEGNENTRPKLTATDWCLVVAEHTGHLVRAVKESDPSKIEKELLHVAAPLLEMYLLCREGKINVNS